MPDGFQRARTRYNAARREADGARASLVEGVEALRRLDRDLDAGVRRAARDEQGQGEGIARLEARRRAAAKDADARVASLVASRAEIAAAMKELSAFTDPREGVSRLGDDTPIALFPLRLETRYRTIERRGAPPRRVFCVKVFPDDVLVDSFQPEIADAELTNVSNYWVHRWRAAGDPAGLRAAWAALVRTCGAGRARWLIEQVQPSGKEPAAAPGEHVLVIRPATPVPAPEQDVVASFWARVWSTGGTGRDAAFEDLVAEVGAARAEEIEAELAPVNLRDPAVTPKPSTKVLVAFLDLPPAESLATSREAWTRGARAWLLPERLVLVGFRGGESTLEVVGEPIPPELQIGPDPAAAPADQVHADAADLEIPEPLRWTVDFDVAVAQGMAFAVDVAEGEPLPRFDRLFVLGVRLASDRDESAGELETLIAHHQASRKGLALLPQGRATNNTDASSARYSWWEDPEESFEHFFGEHPAGDPDDSKRRNDGAWLAGMLGIDRDVLKASPGYYGRDQAEARAMNVALWPATLGYFMEQMMEPVFSDETVLETRAFFNRFVLGRGTVPLVRVGRQPYGILPATVWSRTSWWQDRAYVGEARQRGLPPPSYLATLYELTNRAGEVWRGLAEEVAHVADPGDDAHQTLLDVIGLHPGSVEFYQRNARSFTTYYNLLKFLPSGVGEAVAAAGRRSVAAALAALAELGWAMPEDGDLPALLEKVFLEKANRLDGPLVDAEVSDRAPLTVARADGLNYVAWLQAAARASHDTLRRQEGFADGPPRTLLYQMLRHALDLGFVDASLTVRRAAAVLTDDAYVVERREAKYIHLSEKAGRSRWESLYRAEPQVTGSPTMRMGDWIPTALEALDPYLASQLAALDVLKTATGGALERAFVEHLDCLTYRFDAWRISVQAVQLAHLRGESDGGFAHGGIYLGAFGWLEDVQPKARTLEPVQLDEGLAELFDDDTGPLLRDPTNFGHVHAPSLDHASAAAILRNGHLVNATPEAPDLLAVDLTSERVRLAQQVVDGIRNGQSLGALLGYRLERALHDEPDLFLDRLIYDLRRAFPLVGNRNRRTRVPLLDKVTAVEARNVVDGAAFVDHVDGTGATTYPYGVDSLPPLDDLTGPGMPPASEIGEIVDRHVAQLRGVADAVADLQVAESVYQVVRGNYDRASATLDAFSKGGHAPVPEVVTTPRTGRTITHRIALHLQGGLGVDSAAGSQRAKVEPALARWIARHLPDPATVFARVTWSDADGGVRGSITPSMGDLGLSPVDLFYVLDAGGDRDMPGFDGLLIDRADRTGVPRPRHDATFSLEYKPEGVAGLTLFEVAPLIRALRGLVLGARPLRPSDVALQNEASAADDASIAVRKDKAEAALSGLQGVRPALTGFVSALEAAIGDGVAPADARDAARDEVDQWMDDLPAAVRPVVAFGLENAGLTAAVEARRARFRALLGAMDDVVVRWEQKEADFDAVMDDYAALPGGATDEQRTELLVRAGRIVSTTVIAPLPPTVPGLEAQVASLRDTFDTALGSLRATRAGATRVGATLSSLESFLPAYGSVDQTPLDVSPLRDSVLALAQELQQRASLLRDDVDRRIADATAALERVDAAAGDKAHAAVADAAKAVLGDSFVVLPEFVLSSGRLAEWDNAWAARGALKAHLSTPFPLDDWLFGIARVRERPRHLETVTFLGEALGAAAVPKLEGVQFPFRSNDAWLGLDFPATFPDGAPFVLDEDKLLYSACFGAGAAIDPADPAKRYSGLLLDEWGEVVPVDQVTTGLAFHFDRPSSEAPQAILLATPPAHRGAWRWDDLVDTLHETLDLAQLRAVEPAHLDRTELGRLIPALLSPVTLHPITASLNLAFNNDLATVLAERPT